MTDINTLEDIESILTKENMAISEMKGIIVTLSSYIKDKRFDELNAWIESLGPMSDDSRVAIYRSLYPARMHISNFDMLSQKK